MRVLGIESSCDETGVAIFDTEQGLLGQALYSQIDMHAAYGGVVPELASRDHVRRLLPLVRQVMSEAGTTPEQLDGVAFTAGPGLAGALLVGAGVGRSLAYGWGLPAVPVHHMEGHLLAPMLERLAQNLYIGPPRPMQAGAMAAFDDYALLQRHVDRYRENRDILMRGLPAEFLGVSAPCNGAFYLYADIGGLAGAPDSVTLADAMLREAGVACTPGVDFDQDQGLRHMRLSFAGSTADMKEASRRIGDWLPGFLKTC